MNASVVRVHIERLVLTGPELDARDATAVARAVRAELSRRLTADGVPGALAAGGAWPTVRAPAIPIDAAGGPGALGRSVGASVYRGLGR